MIHSPSSSRAAAPPSPKNTMPFCPVLGHALSAFWVQIAPAQMVVSGG